MGPVGVDPRWVPMGAFHDYLLGAFPQVYVYVVIVFQLFDALRISLDTRLYRSRKSTRTDCSLNGQARIRL